MKKKIPQFTQDKKNIFILFSLLYILKITSQKRKQSWGDLKTDPWLKDPNYRPGPQTTYRLVQVLPLWTPLLTTPKLKFKRKTKYSIYYLSNRSLVSAKFECCAGKM